MTRFIGGALAALVVLGPAGAARAADTKAVLDKAVKALGGEEKLKAMKGAVSKAKGTITFNDTDNEFTGQTTVEGLHSLRAEIEGNFGGMDTKVVVVLKGDKAWVKFGDMKMEMEEDALAAEKRNLYLQAAAMNPLVLREKGFKVKPADETKVGGKPAVGLKVTGPDGKDFTLYFDKEGGLPVKQVAKVRGFMGGETTQETTYSDYKEFDGIKRPTRVKATRDGKKFLESKTVSFKPLKKVDPKTFAEPE
jgi:hypothetical protein